MNNYIYFNLAEFHCKCSRTHDEQLIDDQLLIKLDLAREIAGVPFIITSGYRCPKHNYEVGGIVHSAHLTGKAADIKVKGSSNRFLILSSLLSVNLFRIGIGNNFIHVDVDENKPQDVIWLYDD